MRRESYVRSWRRADRVIHRPSPTCALANVPRGFLTLSTHATASSKGTPPRRRILREAGEGALTSTPLSLPDSSVLPDVDTRNRLHGMTMTTPPTSSPA